MPVETEIKLRLAISRQQAHQNLERRGYRVSIPRVLEIDQLYDLSGGELRNAGKLLRLRSAGERFLVTYKGPAARGGLHKSREEVETELADQASFVAILQALGYTPTFRYEKYRTIYSRSGEPGIVTLDETPIGLFLELEGEGEWIDRTAAGLGFAVSEYLTASYSSLYREFRASNPGVPSDMTF